LSISRLKDLLKFFVEPPTVGLSKMKKDELIAAVKERLLTYTQQSREEV
jgi:hypothetical protein